MRCCDGNPGWLSNVNGKPLLYWPSRRSRGSRRRGRVGSEGIKTGRKHDRIADNTIPTFFSTGAISAAIGRASARKGGP